MEAFRLISMTDFVLEQTEQLYDKNQSKLIHNIVNYAQFLKQPLTLGMFVPCDDEGNVWEYPPTQEEWEWATKDSMEAEQSFRQKEYYYQKAKEKVLFEGFKFLNKKCVGNEYIDIYFDLDSINIYNGNIHFEANLIEDLIKENIILTLKATKQFL